MKVYKDIVGGDELLSDAFAIKEDGPWYVVEGKYVTRAAGAGGIDIGGDSEVHHAEEADPSDVTVLNVADAHGLVPTEYSAETYAGQVKRYLKKVSEAVPADERAAWGQEISRRIKAVLADFDSYRFFTGQSMHQEAMVVLMKTGEDGQTPFLYYIRHGLKAEER
ncbi:translationally-controlled tumor protein [Streptomyces sp. SID4982]|uniref:translationally-controlled tumor protein n=1 Tax=Streptomyces sp. SID4982 TaxID=2690291 RepID=UPI00136C78DE|nr:translationally-controlled tumor protein [Streptomyces sp. SID4982]MYS13585.1 hypothetical protein [Streptomyces sp. SID4982]